ncbi:putative phage abortive infection protein [Brevundimonas aurifodinae]
MRDPQVAWLLMLRRPPAIYVLSVFGLWWIFVGLSGFGVGRRWDFEATGQLGDSFGILSALMASMAAIFTYQTLVDTRRQASIAEADAETQRNAAKVARAEAAADREAAEARNAARDKAESRRDNERTYFGLLDLRYRVLADLKTGKGDSQQIGTDAAASLVSRVGPSFYSDPDTFSYADSYEQMFSSHRNDLGHYFRFTYHIIKFARDNFGPDAYEYVRLLRAQLSNAEITLIALNCAHGEGREKFLKWVETYSLLHNIDPSDRVQYKLDLYFRPKAFDPQAKASAKPLGEVDPLSVAT